MILFQFALASISFGFFIAALDPLPNDESSRSKPLLAILILISIFSGTAGFIQYFTDRTIDDLNATNHDANVSNNDVRPSTGVANPPTIQQWSKTVKSLLQPSLSSLLLLHGPAITLLLYLIVRLFATDNFQSQPASFEFGPKYGLIESDGSFESNAAFQPEFNSYGHSFQGLMAALLSFPAVSGWIAREIGRIGMERGMVNFGRVRGVLSLITLTYSVLTFYATYNLFKRVNGKGYPAFASTSYVNNGMEWSTGYALGLAFGMFSTAVMMRFLVLVYPVKYDRGLEAFMKTFDVNYRCEQNDEESDYDNDPNAPKYVFGKLEDYTATSSKLECSFTYLRTILFNDNPMVITVLQVLSNLFLVIFTISTFLCGVYMGTTWNKCTESDGNECINSTTNGVDAGSRLTFAFICMFIGIQLVCIGISIRMHRLRICCKD